MILAISFVVLGLVLLVVGGDLLVRGASALARALGISPTVVGLTVVAAGTSMPELVVSVKAAISGSSELAIGNVVGSNIFNIAVVLGLAALIAPLRISGNTVKLEWPVMLLASLQLFVLARDGLLDRLEGAFLVVGLALFIGYVVRLAKRDLTGAEVEQLGESVSGAAQERTSRALSLSGAFVVAGAAILALGGHCLVVGAVWIAARAGISETIIGLTVVAAGTSLPELAASAIASFRGHDDIAIANVIGSNIFNILGIAGVTAIIHPLGVPSLVLERDLLWMLAFTLLLFPLMRTKLKIGRIEGAFLLVAFALFLTSLFFR